MKSLISRLVLLLPLVVFAAIEDDFIQMVLRDCYSEESTVSLQSNAIDKLTCLDYHMTSTFNGHGIPRMLSLFQIHTGLTLLSIEAIPEHPATSGDGAASTSINATNEESGKIAK